MCFTAEILDPPAWSPASDKAIVDGESVGDQSERSGKFSNPMLVEE